MTKPFYVQYIYVRYVRNGVARCGGAERYCSSQIDNAQMRLKAKLYY